MKNRALSSISDEEILNCAKHAQSVADLLRRLNCNTNSFNRRYIKQYMERSKSNFSHILLGLKSRRVKRSAVWVSVTDEEFSEIVKSNTTYIDLVRFFGLAAKGSNYSTVKERIKHLKLNTSHFKKPAPNVAIECPLEDIIYNNKHPDYKTTRLKNRLFAAGLKEKKCEICKITEWMGKEVVFHLDHIDGNNKNHHISNLRVLCPTCHSQTDTYAGKKRSKK